MNPRKIVLFALAVLTAPLWVPLRILSIVFNKLDNVKLFEIKGIPTYLSSSLVIFISTLIALTCLPKLFAGQLWDATVLASKELLTWVILYTLVTIHEYGHSLTAKHLGYAKEAKVTLYPFAGLASIDGHWHENPKDEFWIIVNGPATNLVMALAAWPFVLAFAPADDSLLLRFFEWNVVLLAFNALPIFPMDGGRIVRCWLTGFFKGDWVRSTFWTAAWTTVAVCVIGPLLWLYFSPIASILICIMALMGWGEYIGLKQLRDKPDVREMFEKLAKSKFPDEPEKQEAFIEQMLQIDKLMDEITELIVQIKRPPAGSSKAECKKCAESVMHTLDSVFGYIYQMPEEERLEWNRQYNEAEKGSEREQVLLNFIDRVLDWAVEQKMGRIEVEIVEITDPNDVAILSGMQDCTIVGEMVLPSGLTIPAAPTGKCWHVNDGVISAKELEDGE